ncbi:MAG: hypothetical protein ABI434_20470, partial [Burkholderiaceae bacterium]
DEHLLGCERQLRLGGDPAPAVDLALALRALPAAGPGADLRAAPKVATLKPVIEGRGKAKAKAKVKTTVKAMRR